MTTSHASAPPRDARRRRISELAAGQPPSWFSPFRSGYLQTPVIRIPQDCLVYRAENGRLIAELEEHVRGRGMTLSELAEHEQTEEVQTLLHGFLAAKAADPKGPILQELRRQAQQTEPLLITAEGVLVNGNRRLAAMRELLAEDPIRFAGFAEVSAAVLPANAGAADVESVEAALQLAPETKLAYGWLNRRLKLRRQIQELGLPREAIADAYRLTDPAQIDGELEELVLAEDYLSGFLDEPGRYSLIADAELLFAGLARRLAQLPQDLQPTWRLAGFCMIHGRAGVDGPMDRHFPFAEPSPEHLPSWALRRFAEEHDLVPDAARGPEGGWKLDARAHERLRVVFADASRSGPLARSLFELMERLRAEHQEGLSPKRLLKLLDKLHDALRQMQPDRLTDQQRRTLKRELAAVQAQASVLLADAPRRQTGLAARLGRLLAGR